MSVREMGDNVVYILYPSVLFGLCYKRKKKLHILIYDFQKVKLRKA